MDNVRRVEIIKKDFYPSKGMIATIQFLDNLPPSVGEILEFETQYYKVCGVIVSGSSNVIKGNFVKGIYDCLIEKVNDI